MSLFPSENPSNPAMPTCPRAVTRRARFGISLLLCALVTTANNRAQSPVPVDLSRLNSSSEVSIERKESVFQVLWPASMTETAWLALNIEPGQPLFESVGIAAGEEGAEPIAQRLDPFLSLTAGVRDPAKARQAHVFFDNPRHRVFDTHLAVLNKKGVRVSSEAGRTTLNGAFTQPVWVVE